MNRKSTVGWAVTVLFVGLFFYVSTNYQAIQDWWTLRNYQPAPEIANLSKLARFSEEGERLFYVSNPTLLEKIAFNDSCEFTEFSIVVGCYVDEKIFILDIEDEDLEPGEVVTAAHEMLHVAYSRLSNSEKEAINSLLMTEVEVITDEDILETIDQYKEASPDTLQNELHSILGTEVVNLSNQLESYYAKYIIDRQEIAKSAQAYDLIFSELEEEAEKLAKELNALADSLDGEGSRLQSTFNNLEQQRINLQKRINSGENSTDLANDVEVFEVLVEKYNLDVNIYEKDLARYKNLKANYDKVALRHGELIRNIDSNFIPEEIIE
jgi:hypothetical protein